MNQRFLFSIRSSPWNVTVQWEVDHGNTFTLPEDSRASGPPVHQTVTQHWRKAAGSLHPLESIFPSVWLNKTALEKLMFPDLLEKKAIYHFKQISTAWNLKYSTCSAVNHFSFSNKVQFIHNTRHLRGLYKRNDFNSNNSFTSLFQLSV